jgi:putative transposase
MAMHNRLIRTMLINIVTELNPPRSTGRPRVDVGMCVDDVLHMCRTSQPWATLRTTCGSFKTVYKWFRDWVDRGVFDLLWSRVQALYLRRRPSRHHIVDTSYVKNILGIDCIGKNPTDRGRSATKVSAVTDDIGVPIRLHLFPGNASDQKVLPTTYGVYRPPVGLELYADKGYDSMANRRFVSNLGYKDRIMHKGESEPRSTENKRIFVEHSFSWLKQYRRLRLRYEKHIENFQGFLTLAAACLTCTKMGTVT